MSDDRESSDSSRVAGTDPSDLEAARVGGHMMANSTRRLRVLFLTPYMKRGGSQSFISALLDGLDRAVFAPELGTVFEWETEYTIPADVPIHQVDLAAESAATVAIEWPPEVRKHFASEAAWLEVKVGQVGALVRRVSPDVVFCSPEWASVMAAAAASVFPAATRLICRVDAPPSMAFPDSGTNRLLGMLARQYLNRADKIAAVSGAVARDLVDNFGVDEGRVVLVRNAVDLTRAQKLGAEQVSEVPFEDGLPSVIFVGRIERVKGLKYLLTAMKEVLDARPARCVLVGDGSQSGYLRALAKHLGISESIHFVGSQANPFRFMSNAAAFVLPSLSEGMPTVLVEAMACGSPVIATDIAGGAVRELLEDGACGLVVGRADAHAIASAIITVLEDGALRQKLVQCGLARAKHFDVPRIIDENEQLLLSVAHAAAGEGGQNADVTRADVVPTRSPDVQPAREGRPRRPLYLLLSNARHVFRSQGLRGVLRRVEDRIRADVPVRVPRLGGESREVRRARRVQTLSSAGRRHVTLVVTSMDEPGVGTAAERLLRHLNRDSWVVSLVEIDPHGRRVALPDDVERFVVRSRPSGRDDVVAVTPEVAGRYRRLLRRFQADASAIADLACALDTDAVIALGFRGAALVTHARSNLPPKTGVVTDFRGYSSDFATSAEGRDVWGSLLRAGVSSTDAVVAPDDDIREVVIEHLDVAAEAVHVVHDPIDAPAEDDPAWTMPITEGGGNGGPRPIVCRVEPGSSDLDTVLEALALAREQDEVRCVVLGRARPQSRELAARVGIEASVEFVEPAKDQLAYLRDAAGYLFLPADGDIGVAAPLAEAIAAGCAVIAPASADAAVELLGGGERGIVVADGDASALAEAMLQLTWDREFAIEIASRARLYLRSVAVGPAVARIESILAEAIRARRAARPTS